MRLFTYLLLIGLYACGHYSKGNGQHARFLNESSHRAGWQQDYLAKLERDALVDSNFVKAYHEKLIHQLWTDQLDSALKTANILIKRKSDWPIFYVYAGAIHHVKGDTVLSDKYFMDALTVYDQYLDTLPSSDSLYDHVLSGKAVALLALGQHERGNQILKLLYNKTQDSLIQRMYSMYFNKSKEQVIRMIIERK